MSESRIKELEDANARLLSECNHMQTEMLKLQEMQSALDELQEKYEHLREHQVRAWDVAIQAKTDREVTRQAASEAIRFLQAELDRLTDKGGGRPQEPLMTDIFETLQSYMRQLGHAKAALMNISGDGAISNIQTLEQAQSCAKYAIEGEGWR